MSWLIWGVVAIAVGWFLLRNSAHGHAGRRAGHAGAGGLLGSPGGHPDAHGEQPGSAAQAPEAAVEPVSGEAVRSAPRRRRGGCC
jgi:hypothetical protein